MKKYLKPIVAVVLLCAIGGGLYGYWRYESLYPSTEDAYIKANIVSVAAETTGKVVQVDVAENDHVQAGDPLFAIDDSTYRDAVDQAQAQLASAKAMRGTLKQKTDAAQAAVASAQAANNAAQAQLSRTLKLHSDGTVAQATVDSARTAAAQAQAALDGARADLQAAQAETLSNGDTITAAEAALRTAQVQLDRTRITAPVSGWIANLTLRKGSAVSAYVPLFSIVEDGDWWVDANFKETDLERIEPGQPVTVKIDMAPETELTGHVASIGRGSGATFSLLPAENASGNWVKVTQRFPVRIRLSDPGTELRVGASSKVTVDTTAPGGAQAASAEAGK